MPSSQSLFLLTVSVLMPTLSPVWASDEKPIVLEPITVDARHWQESLYKAPVSVSKFSGDEVNSPVNYGLEFFRKSVSNVQVDHSSASNRVVIRGMTAADYSLQDPVGYFVNDVALPLGALQAPGLFDVQSLEVVKGPQGALYGRNTEAGAIKVSTANPDWTPHQSLSVQGYASDGRGQWEPGYIVSGRVSGAIVPDKAAVSLALRAETTGGVHKNLYDDNENGGNLDQIGLSGGMELWVNDATSIALKSVVDRRKLGKHRFRYVDGPRATDRFVTNHNTTSYDDTLKSVQSLRVDHNLGDLDLVSITGWTHFDRNFQADPDSWTMTMLPTESSHEANGLSQEFRLSSDVPGQDWRWLAGLYGFHEWTDIDFSFLTPRVTRITNIDQDGVAAFGQAEFDLRQDLHLGVGGRVEYIRQDGSQIYKTTGDYQSYDHQQSFTTLLPKVSLSYDVTPKFTAYASYARGYLPGGYNYAQSKDLDSFTYDPEYSWTTEVGVKGRAAADRVGAGVALFHTQTTDKQIVNFVVGGSQKISNAAEAEIYGVEANTDIIIDPHWSARATASLQHAEATDYQSQTATGSTDLSGNRLPMAANVTYGLGLSYAEDRKAKEGWFAEASVHGSGPYYFNAENTAKQDTFALCDAQIGYQFGNVEVSLWASNIFDTETYDLVAASMAGNVAEDGRPRTVGLNVSMKW